jgi:hypothetical protein
MPQALDSRPTWTRLLFLKCLACPRQRTRIEPLSLCTSFLWQKYEVLPVLLCF